MTLFRKEAIEHAANRLRGEVTISTPLHWQVISLFIIAVLAIAAVFLSLTSYTRVEVVKGEIVPDRGIVYITPPAAGVVTAVAARNGQVVNIHQPLVSVAPATAEAIGTEAHDRLLQNLRQKNIALSNRGAALLQGAAAERARLAAEAEGLRNEMAGLTRELTLQDELISSLARDLERARAVAENGFVSDRDLQARERLVIEAKQRRADLQRQEDAKRAKLAEIVPLTTRLAAEARAEAEALGTSRAEIEEEIIRGRAAVAYSMKAPIAGTVTALTVKPGQSLATNRPIMAIVPARARLRASLLLSGRAIGFVAVGQRVRIALDAFPYQTFGTIEATITEVSKAPLSRVADGAPTAVYTAAANIDQSSVNAFGEARPLLPGMTLTARVATRRQDLLEWLFEPLYAVARR